MTLLAGSPNVTQAKDSIGVPSDVELTNVSHNIIVTEPGTVVDALDVRGYIAVRADDVTIQRTRVSYSGHHSIRVYPGVTGTVIENSEIRCGDSTRTNGLVFGNYTAERVDVTGCRNSFVHSISSPAVIIDSRADGEPITVLPGPPRRPTATPEPSAPPTIDATFYPMPTPSPTASSEATPSPIDAPSATPSASSPETSDSQRQAESSLLQRGRDGFPDETTTGVQAGTQLTPSGSVRSSHDGQVIENLEITGALIVEHSDVTIRNVRVYGTGQYGISVPARLSGKVSGLLIEDTELIGTSVERTSGIAPYGAWTARRVNISGFVDGIKVGSNQTIEDSWIHSLYAHPGSHNDGIQSVGGTDVLIRGNRIEGREQAQTSAIIIASNFSAVERYTIEGNLLSGGNYTLYLTDKGNGHGSPRDIVVRDNTWVADSWAFGPLRTNRNSSWVWENNRLDTGEPID